MREFDKIKTTITVSWGTKNRLKNLKGSLSYEKYINKLIKIKTIHSKENYIEFQKFERRKALLRVHEFTVLFDYNKYNNSENFIFDINILKIRKKGTKINLKELLLDYKQYQEKAQCQLYFELLYVAITQEIDNLFLHKGLMWDYALWEEEFNILNLPKKSFQEDVMEKIENYKEIF